MKTFCAFRKLLLEDFDFGRDAVPDPGDPYDNAIVDLLKQCKLRVSGEPGKTVATLKVFNDDWDQAHLASDYIDNEGHRVHRYKSASGKFTITLKSSRSRGGNKGLKFEKQVYLDFLDYWAGDIEPTDEIAAVMSIIGWDCRILDVKKGGVRNKKRPLIITDSSITAGRVDDPWKIGPVISDVTLVVQKGRSKPKAIYLSCKNNGHMNYANISIEKILPADAIKRCKITGKGEELLDAFGINKQSFCEVFNKYNKDAKDRKQNLDPVNLTEFLSNSKQFKAFLNSCVGTGYIKVEPGRALWMTKEEMLKRVSFTKAIAHYPVGSAKDVSIVLTGCLEKLKIRFRNKNDKDNQYPTFLTLERPG